MKESKLNRLSENYLTALRTHVDQEPPADTGLELAQDLGVQAVAIGLETLDLAKIHNKVVSSLVELGGTLLPKAELTRRAALFFAEAMTPIEKAHRTALEINADLIRLNETLASRTRELAKANHELRQRVILRQAAEEALRLSTEKSGQLLEESRHLQKHLHDLTRQILTSQESNRKKMSLKLQDDIAQILLSIHVRLLAIGKELSLSSRDLKKEIAKTQRLVVKSAKIIDRFNREFGIANEN